MPPSHKIADTSSEAEALHAYLRAIAKLPRLTPEEERDLGRRIQRDGDQDALRRVRQIEARAKKKLRRSKRVNELRSYLN